MQLQKHNFTPCDIFLCSKTESQLLFRQAFTFILKTVNVERWLLLYQRRYSFWGSFKKYLVELTDFVFKIYRREKFGYPLTGREIAILYVAIFFVKVFHIQFK